MVGAGVLGLPAALSHLGWAGGAIFLLFSIWVRYVAVFWQSTALQVMLLCLLLCVCKMLTWRPLLCLSSRPLFASSGLGDILL